MKKNKLNAWYQDAIVYENDVLKRAQKEFQQYIEKLEPLGLMLDIDLAWTYFGDDALSFERIDMKDGYICTLGVQVRRATDSAYDLDLEAITYNIEINRLRRTIWFNRYKYEHCPQMILNENFIDVHQTIKRVLEEGYDKVLDEIRHETH